MSDKEAVIVAHGSPSDPLPQEMAIAVIADKVTALMPGWTVRGATLASVESLTCATKTMTRPLIYPFFMSEGYFTRHVLPSRLEQISVTAKQLPAFGVDVGISALVAETVMVAARNFNLIPKNTALLLAAHGSRGSPASRLSTLRIARDLESSLAFRAVLTGFIEEPPLLETAAFGIGSALCLPLFTLRASHVVQDVPEAMARAGFQGPVLPPIGQHSGVPSLIAAALERHSLIETGRYLHMKSANSIKIEPLVSATDQ